MEMNQILLTMSQETLANIREIFEWSRVKSQNCSNKEARTRACARSFRTDAKQNAVPAGRVQASYNFKHHRRTPPATPQKGTVKSGQIFSWEKQIPHVPLYLKKQKRKINKKYCLFIRCRGCAPPGIA